MPQRDYILRMIEQVGELLAALRRQLLGQTRQGAAPEASLRAAANQLGMDLDTARSVDADTLVMLLVPQEDPARCWALAETLYLDALTAQTEGRATAAKVGFGKAMRLFSMVRPGGVMLLGWPEAEERIAEIEERLRALDAG